MGDINDIIKSLENDEKLRSSRAFRDTVYTDEPIIRPASALIGKHENKPKTPPEIIAMRQIAYSPEAVWKTAAWLFCKQAEAMVKYEDDFVFTGDCTREYPCLNELSSEQLRGYFSWRTRFRKGEDCNCPDAFVKLYAYEMINLIGVPSPQAALETLLRLMKLNFLDSAVNSLLKRWIADFTALYDMPPEIIRNTPDMLFDSAVMCLMDWQKNDDDALFSAMEILSPFDIGTAAENAADPEFYRKAICSAYRLLAKYFAEHRKNSLADKCFGKLIKNSCHLFQGAVYLERYQFLNCRRALNDIHVYTCENGNWKCCMIYGSRSKSAYLGEIVRCADYLLRGEEYAGELAAAFVKLLSREMQALLDEQKKLEKRRKAMSFDLSRLDDIRTSADQTCEKLIVGEEVEADDVDEQYEAVPETAPTTESLPLDPAETVYLRALLEGGDWKDAAKSAGKLPTLLSDSINTKLFDRFSDTVIENIGDAPHIIEDYAEELAIMLGSAPMVQPENSSLGLDSAETAYLRALLEGGDWKNTAKSAGKLPTLLSDSINTKLFDRFSDTVIENIGDAPHIIEDYAEELANILKG